MEARDAGSCIRWYVRGQRKPNLGAETDKFPFKRNPAGLFRHKSREFRVAMERRTKGQGNVAGCAGADGAVSTARDEESGARDRYRDAWPPITMSDDTGRMPG